jgi:CRISPR-associated endonuclease Csn1
MFPYGIGLDIGITSVGWASVALDESENPMGIIDMGVRIFDAAEQPKTGASLAAPRREARSSRRRLRRQRLRNETIRHLLTSSGLLDENDIKNLFNGKLEDIYYLRAKALDEKLSKEEFARVLIHISQRRGFRSNRLSDSKAEDGKLLKAVASNKALMADKGYRTVGEMYYKDPLFSEQKRNKSGSYITTVSRDMIESEVKKIFNSQRLCKNKFATADFENSYLEILLSQRSFDEGPGGKSPYGGNQIEKMVGTCTFEPEEPRAAKATFSFEYFSMLEEMNHIRIEHNGVTEKLTDDQRKKIINLAYKTDNINYQRIRKELALEDSDTFNTVNYSGSDYQKTEKEKKFRGLKAYHNIRRALNKVEDNRIQHLTREEINAIGTVLTLFKTTKKIDENLEKNSIEEKDIKALEAIGGFSGFGHLSVKACDKLIPYLEKGMNYNDACEAAGYSFKGHDNNEKHEILHLTDEDMAGITSPVARRAISQTVKVLNAIIRKYGKSPTFINIELAREMAKDFDERRKLEKGMEENRANNERLMDEIKKEFGHDKPTGMDLVKYKLFKEQDGRSAYSLRSMSIEHLFDVGYAEVDHIIPYSISFDDTYKNKVLVLAEENRDKGNRIPLEYLKGKQKDDFIVWVNNSVHDQKKRQRLLKEALTDEDISGFKERNLQDTKTISKFMLNYISDNLKFEKSATGKKKHVTAVNGALTSYLRKRWGIVKIRENGDLHHAQDAVVIACTTDRLIQQITKYEAFREAEYSQDENGSMAVDRDTGEIIEKFPYPWYNFRKEVEARISDNPEQFIKDLKLPFYSECNLIESVKPLFVSRMPRRKVTGPVHKETIKSAKALDNGYLITKQPLSMLKLISKKGEESRIDGYYNPSSDTVLYNALIKRLSDPKFEEDAKKAFKEPFYKPKSDGTRGPIVRKVKLIEKSTLNVPVHKGNGVAENDTMVRIDIYYVENDGYYFVPIYVADTLKSKLPNKACVGGKPYSDWKEMDDENFVFSLYPNDLICVSHKNNIIMTRKNEESSLPKTIKQDTMFIYYKKAIISCGAISCITNDNTYEIHSLGIKSLKNITKYYVDVLGNYYPVKKEKRRNFDLIRG